MSRWLAAYTAVWRYAARATLLMELTSYSRTPSYSRSGVRFPMSNPCALRQTRKTPHEASARSHLANEFAPDRSSALPNDNEKINAKLKFAIEAMRPAIQAASDAAHEVKFADENEAEFQNDMELVWTVKRLHLLCPHHLRVLNNVIAVLLASHEHGEVDPESIQQPAHMGRHHGKRRDGG